MSKENKDNNLFEMEDSGFDTMESGDDLEFEDNLDDFLDSTSYDDSDDALFDDDSDIFDDSDDTLFDDTDNEAPVDNTWAFDNKFDDEIDFDSNEKIEGMKASLINDYNWDEEELEDMSDSDIIREYEDVTDTSWLTGGNESLDDFFEHEDM